jgi:glyoxylase-like metal-dependent hydrolase (beta-lactamase superfamily II)
MARRACRAIACALCFSGGELMGFFKRGALFVLMLLLSRAGLAEKAGPIRAEYVPDEIAAGVFVIHGPLERPSAHNQGFMNNPAFVIGESGVVVVDPGATVQVGDMLVAQIEKATDKPVVAVFNTHVHGDHWLGNQAIHARWPEAQIYGHQRLLESVEVGAGKQWVELMLGFTEGASAGTEVVPPTQAVNDGDVLQIDGLRWRVIHNGKAHTETDIMLLVEERGVIFLGDNGLYQRMARLDDGSFRGNIEALNMALDSDAKVFVPGHGKSGGAEAASDFRDYLVLVWERVQALYDEGLSDFEIKPKLAPLLTHWQSWSGFDDEFGRHISIAVLEAESAAFE